MWWGWVPLKSLSGDNCTSVVMGACSSVSWNVSAVDLSHFDVYGTVGKGGFGKVNMVQRRGPLAQKGAQKQMYALKRMAKDQVANKRFNVRNVWVERDILAKLHDLGSPFLCSLFHAFQSATELFLVIQFMQGGDLRYQLNEQKSKCMPEDMCQFYVAQMVLGLEALHSLNIVYRDLKPENALLDADGNLRLSDFGISEILTKESGFKTRGRCGTFGYQAPEMLLKRSYGFEVDFWALGITVYELLHGRMAWRKLGSLFSDGTASSLNAHFGVGPKEIEMLSNLHISRKLSPRTRSLLQDLLQVDPERRLGCSGSGWQEVKNHAFFQGIDWDAMAQRKLEPFIRPKSNTAYYDGAAQASDILLDRKPRRVTKDQDELFAGFEYNVELPHSLPSKKQTAIAPDQVQHERHAEVSPKSRKLTTA